MSTRLSGQEAEGVAEVEERATRVADRLHSVSIHLLRRVRRGDEAAGLTAPQLSALSVIVVAGPLTAGELADAEQVRPPTISRLLQRLERDGLVTREPDLVDGRVVRVRATPAGQRVLEQGRTRRVGSLARQVERLPPADLAALESAVEVLERLLEQGR